jgi:hypothetical protein
MIVAPVSHRLVLHAAARACISSRPMSCARKAARANAHQFLRSEESLAILFLRIISSSKCSRNAWNACTT